MFQHTAARRRLQRGQDVRLSCLGFEGIHRGEDTGRVPCRRCGQHLPLRSARRARGRDRRSADGGDGFPQGCRERGRLCGCEGVCHCDDARDEGGQEFHVPHGGGVDEGHRRRCRQTSAWTG